MANQSVSPATVDKRTDSLDQNPILHATRIDILRHGECEGGAIFRGSTDVNLTPEGFAQMQSSSEKLQQDWDMIISSPMLRCHKFADHIAEKTQLTVNLDDRLREMHFGVWDGEKIDDVWHEYTQLISQWREDPDAYTPPEGEPLVEVFSRVEEFYQEVLAQHAGKKILVVAHGGIIRVVLSLVLQLPRAKLNRFEVPYASVSTISVIHTAQGLIERLHAHNF
ncbi:Putative phosphoserine phosphatase 2 [Thalassocella blandensis]|nr:Putative phosphoserine phosphatase 2 [Thalassocella blandensis]